MPGPTNVEAGLYSRELEDTTEWQLNPAIFKNIIKTFGTPNLDVLDSRINKQLPKFVSRHPEPEVWATDAFSLIWKQMYFYMFPPFSLIVKSLQGKNQSHNYQTKLVITTLVPSNIFPSHSGTGD